MKRLLLALVILFAAGCGTDANHPFFKPEISGAAYAAPTDAAQNVRAELDTNIRCDGGGPPCVDTDGVYEEWGFVDSDTWYAAPSISSPNRADSDGGINKAGDGPTADD